MSYTTLRPVRSALTLGLLGFTVVLSGCGSSGSSSGSKAEEGKAPTQVLADAKSALLNAKAVHVTGTFTISGGTERLDVQFQGHDAAGSTAVGGEQAQFVRTGGSSYLKAPAAFWTKAVGPRGAALANKWIIVTGAQAEFVSQLSLQGLAGSLNDSNASLTGGTKQASVDGTKALLLTLRDGTQFFVADSATPVPLKITRMGAGGAGTIIFSDYGKTQTITAPKGAVSTQQALAS